MNQWSSKTLAERFWVHVDKNGPVVRPELGPCWFWTGALVSGRYGNIRVNGKSTLAHRAAWYLETGKWPQPFALHKCDNERCVRFSHLFEGNQKANMEDMISKGRMGPRGTIKGEQITNSKLTKHDVLEIRRMYNNKKCGQQELAEAYNVSRSNIGLIIRRLTWGWL